MEKEHRVPGRIAKGIALDTVGNLFRYRPFPIGPAADPDAHIRVLFMGPPEPCSNKSSGRLLDRGGMAAGKNHLIRSVNELSNFYQLRGLLFPGTTE